MGEVLDTEAQKGLPALLRRVAAGEKITILSEGRAVAELTPAVSDEAADREAAWDALMLRLVPGLNCVQPTTVEVLQSALAIATRHGFQTFDSIILAAAAQAGCSWLLSEDIPAGTIHAGCQVANPFLSWPPGLACTLA